MYQSIHADCFQYLPDLEENSIAAMMTGPPYGVKAYTSIETGQKQNGNGGMRKFQQRPSLRDCRNSKIVPGTCAPDSDFH